MRAQSHTFFQQLLETPGPTGDERAVARVWRTYTEDYATTAHDPLGSSHATVNEGGTPHLAVVGHIDEIALVVNHIDDEGFLWFGGVGGWDPEVLVSQRVRILTANGAVPGLIGKKARHHQDPDEREKVSKIETLWIDIGSPGAEQTRGRVRIGDLAVIEQPPVDLDGERLASRACDNRCGAFVAAEAARLYAESPGEARLTAVASVAEETTFAGASTSAFSLAPDLAVAVDVTNATDHPTSSKHRFGDVKLGKGPVLSRGAGVHPRLFELLRETADDEGIPIQVEPAGGHTGTDADAVHVSRGGIPSAVVSIPLRYMHSPNELLDLSDLEACSVLIAALTRRLEAAPTAE